MAFTNLINDIVKNSDLLQDPSNPTARQNVIAAATALIQQLEIPPETLARIGWGDPSRTAAVRVAFELGLLAKLSEEPKSSAELAEGTKAGAVLVSRVMKHLVANGLVNEPGKDQYTATPFTYSTNDPIMAGGLTYSFEGMIPTFHGLPEFLAKTDYQDPKDGANGPVQHGLRTDKSFFAILQENARLGGAFNKFMAGYAQARPRWVDYYPCEERLGAGYEASSSGPLVVDVGGGLGHDLSSFVAKYPHLAKSGQLVLQDTPSVIAQTVKSSDLSAAITPVDHDFFEAQPTEYRDARAYFLRLVLHDWPDDKCHAILERLKEAMKPGYSKLLINENVLSDAGAPWQQTSLDWTMMAMLVSRERTESQWKELLSTAGFKVNGIWQKDPTSESIIEAVLADD